jgi:hypothetical protein
MCVRSGGVCGGAARYLPCLEHSSRAHGRRRHCRRTWRSSYQVCAKCTLLMYVFLRNARAFVRVEFFISGVLNVMLHYCKSTCFTGTKVALSAVAVALSAGRQFTQFTCFPRTRVQNNALSWKRNGVAAAAPCGDAALYIYIHIYIYIYICMYVRMYVCVCLSVYLCLCVCVCVYRLRSVEARVRSWWWA